MTTSFLTDMLARQAADRAALSEELSARHAAEIEAEIELRTMNIMAELQGIRQLGAPASASTKAARQVLPVERTKRAKRTPAELVTLTGILLKYITKHPGQRIEKIAPGLGTTTGDLKLPIKTLIADKRVTTKGQKRSTTYFAK